MGAGSKEANMSSGGAPKSLTKTRRTCKHERRIWDAQPYKEEVQFISQQGSATETCMLVWTCPAWCPVARAESCCGLI